MFIASPIRKPPAEAPATLPTPPTIAATTPIIRAEKPMVGVMSMSRAMRMAEAPASAEPRRKAKRITLSMSMPETLASSELDATARSALPILVNLRIKAVMMISATATAMMVIWIGVMRASVQGMRIPTFVVPVLMDLMSSPKMREITFWRMTKSPSDAMRRTIEVAFLFLMGRYTPISIPAPMIAAPTMASGNAMYIGR